MPSSHMRINESTPARPPLPSDWAIGRQLLTQTSDKAAAGHCHHGAEAGNPVAKRWKVGGCGRTGYTKHVGTEHVYHVNNMCLYIKLYLSTVLLLIRWYFLDNPIIKLCILYPSMFGNYYAAKSLQSEPMSIGHPTKWQCWLPPIPAQPVEHMPVLNPSFWSITSCLLTQMLPGVNQKFNTKEQQRISWW